MDILDDMGVSKLSAKVFLKVNYSFKEACSASCRIYYKQTSSITRCITVVVWGKSLISKTGLFSFFFSSSLFPLTAF